MGNRLILELGQLLLGSQQHIVVADLGALVAPGRREAARAAWMASLGVQSHGADGGDLLLTSWTYQPVRGSTSSGRRVRTAAVVEPYWRSMPAVGHAAVGGNAAEAAHPDGTGQVIAIAFGGSRGW